MNEDQTTGGGPQQPSEEELRAALEEQMRNITVADVVVQTTVTLVNLAARHLGAAPGAGEADRDVEQARQAIDATRALLPLLPDDAQTALREPLAQLQMRYASAVKEAPATAGEDQAQTAKEDQAAEGGGDDEQRRAEARSRIWTPPGT